jgi:hypothetical protein
MSRLEEFYPISFLLSSLIVLLDRPSLITPLSKKPTQNFTSLEMFATAAYTRPERPTGYPLLNVCHTLPGTKVPIVVVLPDSDVGEKNPGL